MVHLRRLASIRKPADAARGQQAVDSVGPRRHRGASRERHVPSTENDKDNHKTRSGPPGKPGPPAPQPALPPRHTPPPAAAGVSALEFPSTLFPCNPALFTPAQFFS